jgi:hypothetical protein
MADPQAEKSNDMNDEKDPENDLLSLAHRLDSFAATLPKSERLLLAAIIFNLMDPIERMKWRNVTNLLEPDEIEILNKLQREGVQQ